MTKINYPQAIQRALRPTRIERLARYGERFPGVELWIKRDDLTGFELSGNKIRKLEFSLGAALAQGADGVVTCGGVNSNHCRATTFLARSLGLEAHLFLRSEGGREPECWQGNTLLNKIAGAKINWISPEQYADRDRLLAKYAEDLGIAGQRIFVIPEGASDALGALGFVRAVEELEQQLQAKNLQVTHVVHAVGSGGTTAGLSAGRDAMGARWQPLGYAVCDDAQTFINIVAKIRKDLEYYGLPAFNDSSDLRINADYQGEGYGLTTTAELQEIADFAKSEGILLDPCYTGKALIGMASEIVSGRIPLGSRVLFWHTGGALANFSYEAQWQQALR